MSFFGAIQDGGGVLVGIVWLVLEVRRTRKEFNVHQHDDDGLVIVPLRHER